jgi:surface protein
MKIFLTPGLLVLVTIIYPGRYCDARMTPLFSETLGARNSNRDADTEKATPHTIRRLRSHQQNQNHRDLQTCEALLVELPGLENPDYCTCQAAFGASIFEVTCDFDCSVCEGGFGTSFPQTCADFESQFFLTSNGLVISSMECVHYSSGRTERLCLEYVDASSCTVTLNGTACNSCEWAICKDGSREPLVNCSNFVDGALWNTCSNNVQIPPSSPFAPLSRRFFPVDECYAQLPDQDQIIEATTPPSRAPDMAPVTDSGQAQPSIAPVIAQPTMPDNTEFEATTPPSRAPVLAPVTDIGQPQPSPSPVVTQPIVFDDSNLRNAVLMWKTERSRAIETYGPIGDWDVSGVSNMHRLFQNDLEFNDDISRWNTSNVISMYIMFEGATSFNQPLSSWNTSKVTNTGYMFYRATAFNQPLSSWDTSKVTTMYYMFYRATAFNQPLSSWDTSKVTNMGYMFYAASMFNQPLSSWDTSKVTNMGYMFYAASSFNQPLSSWDTSNVVLFDSMFESALVFNGDLQDWDTSSARSMKRMFYNADSFAQELCWDLSQVQTLSELLCSTPASLDPSCTPSNALTIARCNGRDPSSPTPSPVATRPSSNTRGNGDDDGDDDSALSTGVVFVIVLAIFTVALVLILLYCRWQLERVNERLGASTASGKDTN